MGLSTLQGEDEIVAKIEEIPGIDVLEGEYTDDSFVPTVDENDLFRPYVLVSFTPSRIVLTDTGIAQPHKDTETSTFEVFIVTPNDRLTREIRDQVKEKLLVDFRPTDGSFLRPRGGYKYVDPDLGYHRYVQVLHFNYQFNLS